MNEPSVDREDIHLVSRHSNWTAQNIQATFEHSGIYTGKAGWRKFLNFFLIGLGLAFVLAGIIFFFAFNWASLHKVIKLGLVETLIAVCIAVVVLNKRLDEKIKNILLATASILVGALFAVFGQIYQTGADAYDLFLGWTLAILIWTLVSGFPVLWFIFMLLCNATLCLYIEQRTSHVEAIEMLSWLFGLNALFALLVEAVALGRPVQDKTGWLSGLAAIAAVCSITIAVCLGIIDRSPGFSISLLLAIAGFAAGIWYGLRHRKLLYLALIPFAVIIILITAIVRPFNDPVGIFFLVSLLIIGLTTLLIMQLVKLNKRWHEERTED
ncbi:DUF2157 domain-containing protein [Taibaiella koreensis]|uniref:DUF2157 domain-containing protein n=1 Tax=Taibaiella koreensis TaxID=1268548 RepID=UPI000E59CF5F|nr:DUF2157 domain-containing protein [Taibaiella koreensis]